MAGINKLLYGEKVEEPDKMLTKEEVMDILHIKNIRSFMRLIEEERLPYIKVGKKYLIPLSEYNEWVKKNTIK